MIRKSSLNFYKNLW